MADDVLLRAYTRLLQNKPIQGCNQGLHGFGRPTASVSTRMCVAEVAENINSSLHLGSRVTRIWQINCCCTPGSTVTRVWPTNCSCEPCSAKCCCEHTHTCCVAEHPKIKGVKALADQRVEMLQGSAIRCCCVHVSRIYLFDLLCNTHVCAYSSRLSATVDP